MSSIRRRPQSIQKTSNGSSAILPIHKGTVPRQGGKNRGRSALAAFAIFISGIVILLISRLQSRVNDASAQSSNSFDKVLRIPSSVHANITQFSPCINDVLVKPYFAEINPVLPKHRKKSRMPVSTLCCIGGTFYFLSNNVLTVSHRMGYHSAL